MFNENDMSNSKIDISGVTRPSEFVTNDVSQNMTSNLVTTSKDQIMSAQHKDVAGTLNMKEYHIKYSVNGNNTDTGNYTRTATNKLATDKNTDILINNLQYPNSIYDMSVNVFNVHDMSNAYIDISGVTKPSDFVTSDVTQNKRDTTDTSLVLNINSSQDQHTVDIKNYVVDYSGNNGTNATASTRTLVPTIKTAHSTNNDVTLTDLSANTFYDLSAHLINDVDMSNNKIASSGTTRPSDLVSSNVSHNIGDSTQTKLVMNVDNAQVAGSLNINKYTFDISGTNGTNATLQTIDKTPTNQLAESSNTDVSLNDLSANTLYEMKVHILMKMI